MSNPALGRQIQTTIFGDRFGLDVDGALVVNKNDGTQFVLDCLVDQPAGVAFWLDGTAQYLVGPTGVAIPIGGAANLATVAQMITNALTSYIQKLAPITQLSLKDQTGKNLLTADSITDPTTNLTITQALAQIRASIQPGGATAPVPNAAPYILFGAGATVTITNASPGVINWTGHGFSAGQPVQFTTTGSLPTGLSPGVVYYVIAAGLGANAFEVSATVGGGAINTSSAGSGVHTGWKGNGVAGDLATIVGGTYTNGTPTGFKWNETLNGVIAGQVSTGTTFNVTAAMQSGARSLSVTELFTWSGQTDAPGKTSQTYTMAAPVAVPQFVTPPSWGTGSPVLGTAFSANLGTSSNGPTTSVALYVYRNFVSLTNKGTLVATYAGAGSYTVVAADVGQTLTLIEVDTNASGASSATDPLSFSTSLIIQSGTAPQYVSLDANGNIVQIAAGVNQNGGTGAVLPSFPKAAYAVGDVITPDLGVTIGNADPNGYYFQYTRKDNAVGMPAASKVAMLTYTVQAQDAGNTIGLTVNASNSAGISVPVTIDSVPIAGVSSGGGGGGVLSASVVALTDNTTGTAYALDSGAYDFHDYSVSGSLAAPDTKSGGPGAIAVALISGTATNGASATWTGQWVSHTGGTPNATGNSEGGVGISGVNSEVDWTVQLGLTQRTFSIYLLSNPTETMQLVVSLSDGSAANWTTTYTAAGWDTRIDIVMKAGAAGQTCTVKLIDQTGANNFFVQGVKLV